MSDTALDLDLATLVGDMPAVPCEHSQHYENRPQHSDAPASHYAQSFCECGYISGIKAVCPAFAAYALTDSFSQCMACLRARPINQKVRILGPIHG